MAQAISRPFSPRRHVFKPRLVHVGLVVSKVTMGRGFLLTLLFLPCQYIPSVLHTHSFINSLSYMISSIDRVVE